MPKLILILLSLHLFTPTSAQTTETLRREIEAIVSAKQAVVGVAIRGMHAADTLSVRGDRHFPMQSVFKFPIVLCMLAQIDAGKFALEQEVVVQKSALLPGFWSPLRDKYPEGATLPLSELLRYALSQSDNAACDVLLKMLGGPQVVEAYFKGLGFEEISIKINEETMQGNWDGQFLNWTTPLEANRILRTFYEHNNRLLSERSYAFVWELMKATSTGKNRLKGQLPLGTVVAHKTGWSGQNQTTGITAAVNDIGIVFLPDGRYFFISVFVTESKENLTTNEKIIADITQAAWDYFVSKK